MNVIGRLLKQELFQRHFVLPLGVFTFLYCFTLGKGEFGKNWINDLWQSLGIEALKSDPINSLANNHIQPPGLNLIFAIFLKFPNYMFLLQIFFYLVTLLTVYFAVRTIHLVTNSNRLAQNVGILFAGLPTTVLYSLFPYNTCLVAFGCSLFALGLCEFTLKSSHSLKKYLLGILVIFLVRPTFIWLVALIFAFLPLVFKSVIKSNLLEIFLIVVLPVISIQSFYFYKFHQLTTSSLGSLNLMDAMLGAQVINEKELEKAAREDECLQSVAKAYLYHRDTAIFWANLDFLPSSCFSDVSKFRAGQFFAGPYKAEGGIDSKTIQFNTEERLAFSKKLNSFVTKLVLQNPTAPLQMAIGANGRQSTFEILLQPGYQFFFLAGNLRAGAPLNMLTRPVGALFPASSVFLSFSILIFLILNQRIRNKWQILFQTNIFVFFWIFASVLTTAGENARHLVEIYPLLILNVTFIYKISHKENVIS